METAQNQPPTIQRKTENRDSMNNEISSTSSEDSPTSPDGTNYNTFYRTIQCYNETTAISDTETFDVPKRKITSTLQNRNHHKSMGNITDSTDKTHSRVQNSISNVELTRSNIKKFDSLQVPIVGYEVMEECARFTIYKLKVEDDQRDQSWLVFRRYTDFVRLFSRIKAELPSLMLPLPGKRWFRDNFDPAFLEDRVRGLQIFVDAILKKLPHHPDVREFFCLDEPPQVNSCFDMFIYVTKE